MALLMAMKRATSSSTVFAKLLNPSHHRSVVVPVARRLFSSNIPIIDSNEDNCTINANGGSFTRSYDFPIQTGICDQSMDNPFQISGPRGAYEAKKVDEGLFVRMEMPGIEKDDVKIWVEYGNVFVKGEGRKESRAKSALADNYVNFGVFEVYGDRALADALHIVMKMVLSIPLNDILAYRKLTAAYFTFLEVLLKSHIGFILNLDSSSFMFVAGSLQSGFQLLDTNILSQRTAVDRTAKAVELEQKVALLENYKIWKLVFAVDRKSLLKRLIKEKIKLSAFLSSESHSLLKGGRSLKNVPRTTAPGTTTAPHQPSPPPRTQAAMWILGYTPLQSSFKILMRLRNVLPYNRTGAFLTGWQKMMRAIALIWRSK